MKKVFIYFIFILFISCKISKTEVKPVSSVVNEPSISSNSCKIEATIVSVFRPSSTDSNDVCFRHPCRAIAHVEQILQCGSAASVIPDDEGNIVLDFAYTLNKTDSLFPKMKPSYPGLQNKAHFTTIVESHVAPNDQMKYIVYGYELK